MCLWKKKKRNWRFELIRNIDYSPSAAAAATSLSSSAASRQAAAEASVPNSDTPRVESPAFLELDNFRESQFLHTFRQTQSGTLLSGHNKWIKYWLCRVTATSITTTPAVVVCAREILRPVSRWPRQEPWIMGRCRTMQQVRQFEDNCLRWPPGTRNCPTSARERTEWSCKWTLSSGRGGDGSIKEGV